jgi:hypothetical protein
MTIKNLSSHRKIRMRAVRKLRDKISQYRLCANFKNTFHVAVIIYGDKGRIKNLKQASRDCEMRLDKQSRIVES